MATHEPASLDGDQSGRSAVAQGDLVAYDEYIEAQLQKTRSHVRGVDLAAAGLILVAGTLGYFFMAAQIDHWLVSGGLGFWGRLVLLVGYLSAAGWWIATEIVPLLIKRINPLYAASTIESSRPTLKNTLLNFLLFRANPSGMNQKVLNAIEEQAATRLAGVSVDSAVDRTRLIRLGYVLVGILVVWAAYTLVAPKSMFQTVGRVVLPWADINPPTRTTISEVEPGNVQAFRGQQVTVVARVDALPDDGQVMLYYTTADRQIVDRGIEMLRPRGEYRYRGTLPAGGASLQQSLSYRIEAGDAVTRTYALDVVAAPTIVVEAVEYEYPDYTGLLAQRVEHQGDIKAIEGTRVTLDAVANQDIQSAYVDFDCNHSLDLRMRCEGQTARASFTLSLEDDRQTPEHGSYQVVFKNAEGRQNPQPVRHQIDVTRDVAPEIQIVSPRQEQIELPLDAAVDLEVVAADPDFALASVQLAAAKEERNVVDESLLAEPWRGQFVKKYRFRPQQLGLEAGDVVEYWAVAVDNKQPGPNRTETSRRQIRIISPSGRPGQGDQLANNDQADQQPRAGEQAGEPRDSGDTPRDKTEPADDNNAQNQPGQKQRQQDDRGQGDAQTGDENNDGQPGAGQRQQPGDDSGGSGRQQQADDRPSGQSDDAQDDAQGNGDSRPASVPNDGTDDGEAIERILKHREQQNDGQPNEAGSQDAADDAAGDQQRGENAAERDQAGQQRSEDARQQQSRPADQEQSGQDRQGESQQGQSQQGRDPKPGQKSGQQQREQAPGERQSGQQQQEGQPAQQSQQGQQRQSGQDGQRQSSAEDKSGPREPRQGQRPEQQAERKPADGKSPDGQSESGQSGDTPKQQDRQQQQGSQSPDAGQQQSDEQSSSQRSSGEKNSERGQSAQGNDAGKNEQSGLNERQAGGESNPSQAGQPGQSPSDETPDETSDEKRQAQGDPQNQQGQEGSSREPGQQQQPGSQSDASGEQRGKQSEQADKNRQSTRDNNTQPDGTPQDPSTQGKGAQSADDPTRNSQQKPGQDAEQQPDARGGNGEQPKGTSGAGQESNENQGAPSEHKPAKPTQKSRQPSGDDAEQRSKDEAQSPNTSERESDSEGQQDGEQSGGGQRGGGQKSNKSGTGGAGQNTAADEGAGRSEEAGDGETSNRGGDDRQAAGQSGQSGSTSGQGSQSRAASGDNEKPGGSNDSSRSSDEAGASGDRQAGGPGSQAGANPSDSRPRDNAPGEQDWQPGTEQADEANLDYARQATDLALEHLKDQLHRDQPDPELLERLGWTRDDMQQFVDRWEKMRSTAQQPARADKAAPRELDEALRSLGLRPKSTSLGSNAARDDRAQGYQESQRTTPPAEYSEAFKAYTQGTARGGK